MQKFFMRHFFLTYLLCILLPTTLVYAEEHTMPEINYSLYTIDDSSPVMSEDKYLMSQIVTRNQFDNPIYHKWCKEIDQSPRYHRKQWEFVYILQALSERGLLKEGKKGIGFGVGTEPLPAVMAKHGVQVLCTDLNPDEAITKGWAQSNQHLESLAVLRNNKIIPDKDFDKLVKIANVDMNKIPGELKNYDFTWSSCALEHLGSIKHGLQFIINSLNVLKPGGLAVHTTEYNLSSDTDTLEDPNTVIFRKRDIKWLEKELKSLGHEVYINYNFHSNDEIDKHIDMPPYKSNPHLRLQLDRYVTTSIGIIVRKNSN